jgi:hypothetical protein
LCEEERRKQMVKTDELLLLHAILEKEDSKALEYYTQWAALVNLNHVEGGSFRLLPLLYKRIAKIGETVPHIARLKGIYLQSLYKNSLLFHRFFSILAELEKMGIRVILLKGIALAAAYYEDVGSRPMNDVDLLVREEDAGKTLRFLKAQGWQSTLGSNLSKPAKHIHSLDLRNQEGLELDVHWRVFYQCSWDGADLELWDQTEDFAFKGANIRILNPTQQILHHCAHGICWNAISSIRWIVDVMKILEKRGSSVNWELLVSDASARNISLTMLHSLSFLKSEFHADIPVDVLNRLNQLPKDSQEIHLFEVLTSPPSPVNIIRKKWLIHSYSLGSAPFWRKAALFPNFLRKAFYQVPFYVQKRIRKKLASRHSA